MLRKLRGGTENGSSEFGVRSSGSTKNYAVFDVAFLVEEWRVFVMGDLDKNGLPVRDGVYSIKENPVGSSPDEIDVYLHPIKGLSCYSEDFGSSGTEGVDDGTDCHVSVQMTGLEFIARVGDLK